MIRLVANLRKLLAIVVKKCGCSIDRDKFGYPHRKLCEVKTFCIDLLTGKKIEYSFGEFAKAEEKLRQMAEADE